MRDQPKLINRITVKMEGKKIELVRKFIIWGPKYRNNIEVAVQETKERSLRAPKRDQKEESMTLALVRNFHFRTNIAIKIIELPHCIPSKIEIKVT